MKSRLNTLTAVILLISLFVPPGIAGAELLSPGSLHDFTVIKNVEWARAKDVHLTMDIYVPKTGKKSHPVLVIFHGGGWLINSNATMDQASEFIAGNSEYIVCNVNYRLLGANGNTTTMNQIVEDALGAVLWVKQHIKEYDGDSAKIAVTGDSAGGQLAAMVVLCGKKLESDGFAGGSFGFCPTYLPPGRSAEEVARTNDLDVQAAILSYGAFDLYTSCLNGFESPANIFWMMGRTTPRGIFGDSISVKKNPDWYRAVSPVFNIPQSRERKLPPIFCTVGTRDLVVTPASVRKFAALLSAAGQSVEYWEYEGRPHAFLDSGSNVFLGINFERDAPAALKKMIAFLDRALLHPNAAAQTRQAD